MKTYQQIKASANNDDANAQYQLALMYDLGLGVDKDLSQAFIWYQKSAQQNYPKAQYNLGVAYALGKGVKKDIGLAKSWVKKANENGYTG